VIHRCCRSHPAHDVSSGHAALAGRRRILHRAPALVVHDVLDETRGRFRPSRLTRVRGKAKHRSGGVSLAVIDDVMVALVVPVHQLRDARKIDGTSYEKGT
jgi:hypothetical protein